MLTRQRRAVAVSTAALVVTGGAAYAAWTVTATGSAAATTTTVEAVSLRLNGDPLGGMWAGDPAKPLPVEYTNPNKRDVDRVVEAVIDSTSSDGCPASSFVITPSGPAHLAASTTAFTAVDRPPTIAIRADAPDACQGVAVYLSFELS